MAEMLDLSAHLPEVHLVEGEVLDFVALRLDYDDLGVGSEARGDVTRLP